MMDSFKILELLPPKIKPLKMFGLSSSISPECQVSLGPPQSCPSSPHTHLQCLLSLLQTKELTPSHSAELLGPQHKRDESIGILPLEPPKVICLSQFQPHAHTILPSPGPGRADRVSPCFLYTLSYASPH